MQITISLLTLSAAIYVMGIIVGFSVFNDVHTFPTAQVKTSNNHLPLSYENLSNEFEGNPNFNGRIWCCNYY